MKINVIEIFSSVQGEGSYIGQRHLFIRFAGCNLNCGYCDTEFNPSEYCNVEIEAGSGNFRQINNPLSSGDLIKEIDKLTSFHNHSISLTGGEPLLNPDYLYDFLKKLNTIKQEKKFKIYLETNGTLYQELEKVIDLIDIISMDIKLESSTGITTPWKEHEKFIKIAQQKQKEIFAKVVLTQEVLCDEIARLNSLIISLDGEIPVILQPVSSTEKSISSKKLLSIQETMLQVLNDVRVIPQMHKYIGLL